MVDGIVPFLVILVVIFKVISLIAKIFKFLSVVCSRIN